MDPIVIDIPGVGPVEFPATMSQDEINAAAKRLHDEANKEPVVEKESPELMGYLGAGAGAVGAAGDVIYSKGRPLIRMGEKMLGMDTSTPTVKPRTFADPSTVAQQAIERRMPTDIVPEGSTTTVRNWTVGKPGEGTGQVGGQEFLGGKNYKIANQIAEAAIEAEKQFPGTKVIPGSLLSVPEEEAKRLSAQKAELAMEKDKLNQAEVQKVAQTRAERLGERADLKQKVARKNIATGAGSIATKVGAPILGGYELGSQGAQAYNRLTRPDLQASDVAAGATNVVGAGAGALSMLPGKYRIPAAILAQGAGAVANWLDKRNPRNEEEQKAKGGLIQHFEKGGVALAKKLVRGYLENTPKKPNPLVGTRFELQDLGGVNPVQSLDITKIKGAMLTPSPADMTSANQKILNVAGIPMTSDIITHGGHPFARSQKNIERGHGWASNENAAKSAQSRADIAAAEGEMLGGTGQTLTLPMTMGKGSENFSVPVTQTYYDILKQAELNPAELQKMNQEIRNYKVRGKTPLQGFVGLEHPEAMKQFLEGGMGLEGSHHDLRKAFVERAQLKDRMRAMGVNAEDIAGAHLDPNLIGVPQGYAGHTVLESKRGAEILPSDSITYSHALQKKYLGDIGNTPVSVLMEKPYKNIYQELEAKFPDKTTDQIHAMTLGALGTRKGGVSQLVDEETINRVGAYHEAVKQGLIDPNDYKAAMEYLSVPGRYAEGGLVYLAGGGKVPAAVVKAYKLFKTKGGNTDELYPLFVNANKPVPLGEWVNAEVGPVAASGKVKSKLGELAYRPGWHAGDLPVATHIGGKSAPDLKAPDFRRPDEVWAEVEMPADVDWQQIANQRARLNKAGEPIASTAHITDQIPEGGFYRYKTSPNMQGNWLIGGGMKVNKVLTDEEVRAINEAAGVADLPRFTKFNE